jgi:hypothetical protein
MQGKGAAPGTVMLAIYRAMFKNPVTGAVRVAVITAFVLLAKISFPGTRGGRWISGAGLLVSAALVVSL